MVVALHRSDSIRPDNRQLHLVGDERLLAVGVEADLHLAHGPVAVDRGDSAHAVAVVLDEHAFDVIRFARRPGLGARRDAGVGPARLRRWTAAAPGVHGPRGAGGAGGQ